ncbi:MAG: preprotein translocase subunit SecG [Treponema sp.]|nr:preprotein translocase subunit SecG [Treponema sp.]
MGVMGTVLLVAFVIVCALAVFFVLIQNDENSGMGLFGGRGTAAFGSHSATVLTKATFVLVVLFFIFSIGLAVINKRPSLAPDLVPDTPTMSAPGTTGEWWQQETDDGAEPFLPEDETAAVIDAAPVE